MSLDAFVPQGSTVTFLAAVAAPTAVKAVGANPSAQQYRVVNAGSSNVFLGFGATSALATTAAAVVSSSGPAIFMLPGTVEVFTIAPNAWFTAVTSSGTSQVYITPGLGL
jgi:hypothetical protein